MKRFVRVTAGLLIGTILAATTVTGISTSPALAVANCSAPAAPSVQWMGCDKTNANLQGADLTNADLTNAILTGANLQGAILTGADLTNADLTYLTGADGLIFADLRFADLTGANLTNADLTGAHLEFATLTGANLTGAVLTFANLAAVVSGSIVGVPASLPEGWQLTNGYLVGPNADLTFANLTGAILTFANLTGANLTGATLTNATLFGAILTFAILTDANLTGANLTAVVSGSIVGVPASLPTGWTLVDGVLVAPVVVDVTVVAGSPSDIVYGQNVPLVSYSTSPVTVASDWSVEPSCAVYSTTGGAALSGVVGVGTYVTRCTGGTSTYFAATVFTSGELSVVKAGSSVLVTCPVSVSFTGSALTPCTATVTGAGGLSSSVAVVYTNNINAGTATADATFGGDANHTGSTATQVSFTVAPAVQGRSQSIAFGSLVDRTMKKASFKVAAKASSKSPVVFVSTTLGVCSAGGINGTAITLLAAGTCSITANQAGGPVFNPAPSVTRTFVVSLVSQTITFTGPAGQTMKKPVFVLKAKASSKLPVTLTSWTPLVCGVNASSVSLLAAGVCTISAQQGGSNVFGVAPVVTRSFAVSLVSQTITFTPVSGRTMRKPLFDVKAKASSKLAVTLTSGTPSVCTVGGSTGRTVTLLGAGVCTLNADQSGSSVYHPASRVTNSFVVVA